MKEIDEAFGLESLTAERQTELVNKQIEEIKAEVAGEKPAIEELKDGSIFNVGEAEEGIAQLAEESKIAQTEEVTKTRVEREMEAELANEGQLEELQKAREMEQVRETDPEQVTRAKMEALAEKPRVATADNITRIGEGETNSLFEMRAREMTEEIK